MRAYRKTGQTHPAALDQRREVSSTRVILIASALVFLAVYLRTPFRWWYEDDPAQYATAAAIANPLKIFTDPAVVRGFGTRASLVPMQLLSYWCDVHLFGISAKAAYLHSLLSTLATTALLLTLLSRLTRDPTGAGVLAILWLALPSTIAVQYFLATRHYMEGFAWSLAACLLLESLCNSSVRRGRVLLYAGLWVCAAAALLSKELYVTMLPAWIAGYSLKRRRYGIAIAAVGLAAAYAGYRSVVLGTPAAYAPRLLGSQEYLRYLAVLPFTLTANYGGYIYYGALLCGAVALALMRPPTGSKTLLIGAFLFLAALIPQYPTAGAMLLTFRTPGTWYRAVFLSNAMALLFGGYLLLRFAGRRLQALALGILLVILLPGAMATRHYWDARFRRSEAEGRFYLANPEKLVYSEEDAAWFLHGLDRLYRVPRSHYISKLEVVSPQAKQLLSEYQAVWRYRSDRWSPDPALYEVLVRRNREQTPVRSF